MILAAALLEVLSVLPAKDTVRTDETFAFTVKIRNAGPDAAQEVKLRAGSNSRVVFRSIEAPPEWECDATGPRFTSFTTCISPTLLPNAEAEFRVTMTAPQPSAMTFRIGAAVSAKDVRARRLEMNLGVEPADTQAELSASARRIDAERASYEVRNRGPQAAKNVMLVIANAALATGDGWKCEPSAYGVACTRAELRAGAASTIEARGQSSGLMEAQVRAEINLEEEPRDNVTRPE